MKRTLAIAFLVIGTLPLGLVIQQPASASPSSQALLACRADGATISTAIAAFESQNPGVIPTEAALLSSARGGPYLNGWANNPRFYRFTIVKGVLEVQAGRVGSKPTRYVGMEACRKIGLN